MASETTVKANEPEVKPRHTPSVLEAHDAMLRHRAFERLRALKARFISTSTLTSSVAVIGDSSFGPGLLLVAKKD